VRTTFIVGHPGEEESDIAELTDFVAEYRFERIGCFAYSQEEGTPAGEDPDQVPEAVVAERLERVESAARRVGLALHAARVGETIEVMVDGPPAGGRTPARSTWDAPEIDGRVFVEGEVGPPGTLVPVRVTAAGARDLVAALAVGE
jgi:ribosomal protein S12 methylthiotransferase